MCHDFLYGYGFDEVSGNFQAWNFRLGGIGSDPVRAESQDGSGVNNANFRTPPDGAPPRMQMYRTTDSMPNRDTSLDNLVIAHEYGHGLSQRLTGGPSNVNCLNNGIEQAGEGWSDVLALIMTLLPTDTGATPRGIGEWAFNITNYDTIVGRSSRQGPYSTNMAVNNYTFGDLSALYGFPHSVGFVWCSIYWEVVWELIESFGRDLDLTANGSGGNNVAMQLLVSGLKLQPCRPDFLDVRDAIFLADKMEYNNLHRCHLWRAFAKRGMGPASTVDRRPRMGVLNVSEDYTIPRDCDLCFQEEASARLPKRWVPPMKAPNIPCDKKRIEIPGRGEYSCMMVNEGICRDDTETFGEWRFGIEGDLTVKCNFAGFCPLESDIVTSKFPVLFGPDTTRYPLSGPTYVDKTTNEICRDAMGGAVRGCNYAGTTHICIGENVAGDPNKVSSERPYLFFYNEKSHEFLYQLVCDGIGTETFLPQLKMVSSKDSATPYVKYPVDIAKYKKGPTDDRTDDNELWKVFVHGLNSDAPSKLDAYTSVAHPNFCREYVSPTKKACWENDVDCSDVLTQDAYKVDDCSAI